MHGGVRRADDEAKRAVFNPGQRLLAWARGASVAAMAVTGVQAWPSNQTRSSHGMAVAVTVLLSGQVCMAGPNPPPDLRSSVSGPGVFRGRGAEHHGGSLHDLNASGRPRAHLGPTTGRW